LLVHGEKVREVGPGEVLGEVAVLSSGLCTASVVATSPIRAIALFKRDVWHLEGDAPEAPQRLRAAIEGHVGSSSSDD
jgi:CRP-like cAMP-binding protein